MQNPQPNVLTAEDFLEHYRVKTTHLLTTAIDTRRPREGDNGQLLDAMAYSLLNGGKRIRPLLCYAAAHTIAQPTPATDAFAAALECIHAYSLIHDDLPAMDNDELRRGRPTCHIAFNEATAILAGDGLQALAFELASDTHLDSKVAIQGCQLLAKASGAQGMVLGQAIDLAAVDSSLSSSELAVMHSYKTGALIKASVLMGATSAGASNEQLGALTAFSDKIGLAFQVQDDIIDVTSDTATLGKPQGADASMNKPTFVSLLGLAGAKEKTQHLLNQAQIDLSIFNDNANYLNYLANLIVNRNH